MKRKTIQSSMKTEKEREEEVEIERETERERKRGISGISNRLNKKALCAFVLLHSF